MSYPSTVDPPTGYVEEHRKRFESYDDEFGIRAFYEYWDLYLGLYKAREAKKGTSGLVFLAHIGRQLERSLEDARELRDLFEKDASEYEKYMDEFEWSDEMQANMPTIEAEIYRKRVSDRDDMSASVEDLGSRLATVTTANGVQSANRSEDSVSIQDNDEDQSSDPRIRKPASCLV